MAINKQTRDKIVAKALAEIQFARMYKQGIIWRWHKNEDLFYIKKDNRYDPSENVKKLDTGERSNVNIASTKMYAFVETFLAKIDSPLTFEFVKPTIADFKRAKLLNALKEQDANQGDWHFKDLMGKVNAIIYGRAIFSYYSSNYNGYESCLDVIDPYDFLIDPSAGGYDIDSARYCGNYNIRIDRWDLVKGKKNKDYIKDEVDKLFSGSGNDANIATQEDTNKQNKYSYIGSPANRVIQDPDVYKFWNWYTTYEGERYYLLLNEQGGCAIKCEKLSDIFKVDPKLGKPMFPYWSFSYIPNLTEFWIPAKVDYVREIFLAQGVTVNQLLDNSEQINKPQRAVDVSSLENIADLVYKRNGIIRMKMGVDINKAFQVVQTPPIQTPIQVYNTLDSIQQLESGVTSAAMGVAKEDKVGIYEGNQANTADRYGVINKSYSQGYKRFAKLWKNGVEDNLTVKTAVKILGPDGLEETIFISRRDIKPQADWGVIVKSNTAEAQSDMIDKKNKLTYLTAYKGDQVINQKVLFETGADMVGFSQEEINKLLDVSDFGDTAIMSEAERDMEDLLNKKIIQPNENANTAYAKRILDYMKDHKEDMDEDTYMLFMDYMQRVEPIIVRNMGTRITNQVAKEGARMALNPTNNPAVNKMNLNTPIGNGNIPGQNIPEQLPIGQGVSPLRSNVQKFS